MCIKVIVCYISVDTHCSVLLQYNSANVMVYPVLL